MSATPRHRAEKVAVDPVKWMPASAGCGRTAAEVSGPAQSVGSISNLIGKPLTTTIRWIDYLEKERLIARAPHPLDSRMLMLELTEKGRQVLDGYFATLPADAPSV